MSLVMRRTRLAPSPTGALHLGNARTFLINWLLARQHAWRILLRIEDLDGPRIKRGSDAAAIEDLRWLGLDWEDGPLYQSPRQAVYADAVRRLLAGGHAYPCVCSRQEVDAAASAPHAEDGATVYPGTCRGRFGSIDEAAKSAGPGRAVAVRFRMPPGTDVTFEDALAGIVTFTDVDRRLGDFVIAKTDPATATNAISAAYQLAVVIDDDAARVTDVVRGDDLLDSVPRQILLYRTLGLDRHIPTYTHVPLVRGPDGRRLAKRHGDTRLAAYREAGIPASRLLALMAEWCGIAPRDGIVARAPSDLIGRFDLARLPRGPVTFTMNDDRWLRMAARNP